MTVTKIVKEPFPVRRGVGDLVWFDNIVVMITAETGANLSYKTFSGVCVHCELIHKPLTYVGKYLDTWNYETFLPFYGKVIVDNSQ